MPFKHIAASPDVYMLDVPLVHAIAPSTNCYVVKDGDACAVIDTGAPVETSYRALDAGLNALGVDRDRASFVLTHFHTDHAGLVDRIAPARAKLYVGRTEYEQAQPSQIERMTSASFQRLIAEGGCAEEAVAFAEMRKRSVSLDLSRRAPILVEEGDEIRVGRFSLSVLDLPGHTAGHIALHERSSGTLFCGDHVLDLISPSIDGAFDCADNLQHYLDNLARVAKLSVSTLAWGHGDLSPAFRDRVRWLIHHHGKRTATATAIIRDHPGLTGVDLIKTLPWSVPFDSWGKIPALQRGIILAAGLAVLDHLVARRIVVRDSSTGTNLYRIAASPTASAPGSIAASPAAPTLSMSRRLESPHDLKWP